MSSRNYADENYSDENYSADGNWDLKWILVLMTLALLYYMLYVDCFRDPTVGPSVSVFDVTVEDMDGDVVKEFSSASRPCLLDGTLKWQEKGRSYYFKIPEGCTVLVIQ